MTWACEWELCNKSNGTIARKVQELSLRQGNDTANYLVSVLWSGLDESLTQKYCTRDEARELERFFKHAAEKHVIDSPIDFFFYVAGAIGGVWCEQRPLRDDFKKIQKPAESAHTQYPPSSEVPEPVMTCDESGTIR